MSENYAESIQAETHTITKGELRKLKGGLTLLLMSFAVPVLVLVDVRYLMVGSFVSPEANQILGLIATILLVISWFTILPSTRAVEQGNLATVVKSYNSTMLLGFISWILIGVQVVNHSINSVTHYGETFLASLGTSDVYILFAMVALLSVTMRIKRQGATMNHVWGVHSTSLFWRFTIIAWIIMYVQLYLL